MNIVKKKNKVVLDSNIIISALVYGGYPRTIFENIVFGYIDGVISIDILNELIGVLKYKFDYGSDELRKIRRMITKYFHIVKTKNIPNIIVKDPDDNYVLAICDVLQIDYIISGDKHLLELKHYKHTKIIKPKIFCDKYLNN